MSRAQCCGWIFTHAAEEPCANCPKAEAITKAAVDGYPVRPGDYRNDDGSESG